MVRMVCTLLGFLFSLSLVAQDSLQLRVPGRVNSPDQQQKPYVILISIDGLRYDLVDKYNAVNMQRLRQSGTWAPHMLASYPSLTFPNHYTLVTGLSPAHHGLVNNTFWDPARQQQYSMSKAEIVGDGSWYGGTPLWVLAEQQQMLSACYFWVGSEAAIQNVRPTYYYNYSSTVSLDERIQVVEDWLKLPDSLRPHLICLYFPQVDHDLHESGPESPEAAAVVQLIDSTIGKLNSRVAALGLPVNFIIVSDHGMTTVDHTRAMKLPAVIDTSKFVIPSGSSLVHLYAKDQSAIRPTYQALKKIKGDYEVYLATHMPRKWRYSKKDDRYNRIGDIMLVPKAPAFFHLYSKPPSNKGYHGFDPFMPDMFASFFAWGPAFKPDQKLPPFSNVEIYPLVARLLDLKITEPVDGTGKLWKRIIK